MEHIPIRHLPAISKEPHLSGSYSIRKIEDLLAGNDMLQELHRHDFYYFLVLAKGSGTHEIDFTSYDIQDHTVYMMRPGQVHQLHLMSDSAGYLIQFKTDFLYYHNHASQNHLTKLIQYSCYSFEPEGFATLESLLSEALKEYTAQVKGYQEVLKANLSIFLIALLRQRQQQQMPTAPGNPYAQEKLEQFLEVVANTITTRQSVSHYADLLHLSSYQLNAITKTLLHKTPSEILNESILLEAKRQLLATSNQVSQIAYHLGYDDVSYFIRFFRKHTSVSPEAFRQNSK